MIAVITSVMIPSTQYTEYCICFENCLPNTHQQGMENKYHRFFWALLINFGLIWLKYFFCLLSVVLSAGKLGDILIIYCEDLN